MNGHLGLLADLDKHKLAHVDVFLFGDLPPIVQVDSVCGEGLQEVLESQVVSGGPLPVTSKFVEDHLEDSVAEVDLANDGLRLSELGHFTRRRF